MRCIDDKANGIAINHDGDWGGDVRIAWYDAGGSRSPGLMTEGQVSECWCSGRDLIAGRFVPVSGGRASTANGVVVVLEPPVNVLTRAVALAVETYLLSKMTCAVEELSIDRGTL